MIRISINVVYFSDDAGRARQAIYVSEKRFMKSVELLYWDEHYAWIKMFGAFTGDQSNHLQRFW